MNLGRLSIGRFLRDYWQRQPVLLRNALPDFSDPITPEELAGLACEAEVESRLVFTERSSWSLRHGPFRVRDFTTLPDHDWTLLVQAVDQWVPEVKALLASVPFLPTWRVDDVMISYATRNGGVGPHFDYYDVFLVQGQGSRIWKTGQRCSAADELRADSGLKLLRRFDTQQQWQLQPGDVLYVPPGVAHWGVSVDDSLCYSIGFRAPAVSEMLQGFGEALGERLGGDQRFTDPARPQPLRAGEITGADLQRARQLLRAALDDDEVLAEWFGQQMTQPRFPELVQPPSRQPRLRQAAMLRLHPASRMAWQVEGRQLRLFVDGDAEILPHSATLLRHLQRLCSGQPLTAAQISAHGVTLALCQRLLRQGVLVDEGRR